MEKSLLYWCKLYNELKYNSLCIDIETTALNGPISLIGVYQPKEGAIECQSFIKGQNLSIENLKQAFANCKMLITYNGLKFDIPKIRQEFPGVIPAGVPIFDIYLFSKKLGINTNLKVLEKTLNVGRLDPSSEMRGIAIKLWNRYSNYGDLKALNQLIEYNKQDTVNLYPLAEQLVSTARSGIKYSS